MVSIALSIDGSSPAGSNGRFLTGKKKKNSVYCILLKESVGNGNDHNLIDPSRIQGKQGEYPDNTSQYTNYV